MSVHLSQALRAPLTAQRACPKGEGTGDSSQEHSASKVHREAGRNRIRAREAEAERDSAREELATAHVRIERMQRAEIERLASDHLAMASDLFSLSGNDVADYLNEDGDVDAEKVAADVAAILAERPGLKKGLPVAGYDPTQGYGGRPEPKREATLADLLRTPAHHPY
jgi:hypothetical protein